MLFHRHELTSRFGESFYDEIMKRITGTISCSPSEAAMWLDDATAYLLARASMESPNADLVCNLRPDQAWHVFILYSDEYTQFCFDVAGMYLRHDPAGETALVNTPFATAKTLDLFDRHSIGYHPELWQDHIDFPNGAEVSRIELTRRIPAHHPTMLRAF